jgi:DNA-binding transcriptional regulator YdaS (Cro superfamily)
MKSGSSKMGGAKTTPTRAPHPAGASTGLPERVVAVARHIVGQIRDAKAEEMRNRYELGWLTQRVQHGVEFQRDALPNLARHLAMSPTTLRQYTRVAVRIPRSEFETYVHAASLTWSHLEELAEVRSPNQSNVSPYPVLT